MTCGGWCGARAVLIRGACPVEYCDGFKDGKSKPMIASPIVSFLYLSVISATSVCEYFTESNTQSVAIPIFDAPDLLRSTV